jgi:hypothetical protein
VDSGLDRSLDPLSQSDRPSENCRVQGRDRRAAVAAAGGVGERAGQVGRPAVGTSEEPKGNLGSAGTILPGAVLVKVDALGGGAATVDRGQCGNYVYRPGVGPCNSGGGCFHLVARGSPRRRRHRPLSMGPRVLIKRHGGRGSLMALPEWAIARDSRHNSGRNCDVSCDSVVRVSVGISVRRSVASRADSGGRRASDRGHLVAIRAR